MLSITQAISLPQFRCTLVQTVIYHHTQTIGWYFGCNIIWWNYNDDDIDENDGNNIDDNNNADTIV